MPPIGEVAIVRTVAVCFLLTLSLAACNLAAETRIPSPESDTALIDSSTNFDLSLAATSSPAEATPIATPVPTAIPYVPPAHRIGVRRVNGSAEFFDIQSGEKFVPRGVNYVFVPQDGTYNNLLLKVGVYDPQRTRQDFGALASLGYNTVRVFLDQCNAGPGCIGDSDNVGLNPAYLDNIADMMTAAKETGIYILFTSNDLPDQGGYAEQANAQSGATFAGYRNSYYLTPGAVEATRRYWRDLLTGLNERNAATDRVLGWQLLNEQWMFKNQPPLSLTSGLVETITGVYDMSDPKQKQRMVSEGLIRYVAETKAEILSHDPTALVTMGFFAPEIVAPDWYVETASLLAGADLDFFDFHAYSGAQSLAELVAAFGMSEYNRKPILLGEYGSFRSIYPSIISAARAVTNWQAESCAYGFDGWIYWTYYQANESAGDRTWGLTDESGFLLEMLAPANHPDPCGVVEIFSGNLAYQKPVRTSAFLPEEPPANAVDENSNSQWGAGADASQWIEIDLEQAYRITEIRLLVAQWPEGDTVHRIRGRTASETFVELHTFRQTTKGGDWLIFTPDTPIDDIQIVRIETLSSPSWVAWGEIWVYGEEIP